METQEEQLPPVIEDEYSEAVLEPEVGALFDSDSAALECYRIYAESVGFGVITKNCKKDSSGKREYVIYSCQRAGKPKSASSNPIKAKPTAKSDCKAQMSITLQREGKWMVQSLVADHNHDMDKEKVRFLKCYRSIPNQAKRVFELNKTAGIRVNKTMQMSVIEAGGPQNLTYTEKDVRNHMDTMRRHELKEGDAAAMMQYFQKMHKDNSDFFYAIDVDKDNRLKNVFWADAWSREAYKEFGDVVTFDTTYLVNRYNMPFAPFVGVNHHNQSILFGCGLVSNEDTTSFVWLFRTWLECMSNRCPDGIITDQCRAMQNAVSEVFPKSRHRWCLWHIMNKIPHKLSGYTEYKDIKSNFKNVVYDSLYPKDFEKNWQRLIEDYKLEQNPWLSGLYEERHRWIPAFVKDTFWAGMSSTQRSESMNSFFDNYVNAKTTLKEFVTQYENALGKKVQKEEDEDLRCLNVQLRLVSPFKFEEQFQEAYTLEKCNHVREQIGGLIGCFLNAGPVLNGMQEFGIEQKRLVGKKKEPIHIDCTYTVHFNEESKEAHCSCRLFESKGMVCAHMILVWGRKNVEQVPDKYILRRWKKNLARSYKNVKVSYSNWRRKPEWIRYDRMHNVWCQAADKAMYSDTKTAIVVGKLNEAIEMLDTIQDDECLTNVPISIDVQEMGAIVGDPAQGPRRGRPSGKRKQSEIEKGCKKKNKKSSNNDEATNGSTECYNPIVTQEDSNFCGDEIFSRGGEDGSGIAGAIREQMGNNCS